MKNRRTIRQYTGQSIPDALLTELLDTASRASTCGNMQLYSVIVTKDPEKKAALAPAHFNQPMVENAAVVLTICIDVRRFTSWCEQRHAEPGYDNFQWFLTSAIDALLFAQTFCNAAEEKGLGICYLGTTTFNPDAVIEILKLPKLVFPITTITCGWPAGNIPEKTDRLPLQAVIHDEYYHDFTSEEIDRLYLEKEQLKENQDAVAENHKNNLAQVYTDIRYPKNLSEETSKALWEAMKKQGF